MDVENNIETPNDDSDILLLCSSSISIILLIVLITVGVYFYYKNTGKEIPWEKLPIPWEKLPFWKKDEGSGKETSGPISATPRSTEETPKSISTNSNNVATFNPSANAQLLLKQGVDTCISIINNGICNNSLVKGDSSFNVTNDGNLVLKKGDKILWQSFTNKDRNTTYSLTLTNSGNLILLTNDSDIVWSNNNAQKEEKSPYSLILRDDSNLVIEDNQKNVVWETGTSGGKESSVIAEKSNTGLAGPSDTSGYLPYEEVVANLPSSFRLDSLTPTDQYDVATCVTSQILGIFTYYYWKLFNKEYWFSRLFTWYYDQVDHGSNPSENNGSSASSVYETIRKRGLLLEKYYKYDGTIPSGPSGTKNTCSKPKYKEKPQDELSEIAKKNIPKFTTYSISITPNLDKLKSAIYNGMPVLCGIRTYSSYSSTSTNTTGVISYPDKTKEKKNDSGHQVSLWGWDDDKQIFHLLNTRGPNYMNKGWCTIPYKYILDPDLSDSFECFKLNPPVADIVDDPTYVNMDDWVFQKNDGCVYVNTVQKGLQCFEPPPPGYNWTTDGGILIGKVCPPGSNDSGTTCWYDRGAGRIPDKRACADGWRDDGTVCWLDTYGRGVGRDADWESCGDGYDVAGTCWKHNYKNSWGSVNCTGGRPFRFQGYDDCYTNDFPYVSKNIGDRARTCKEDEDKDGVLCYPKCKSGYHASGCCLCEPDGGIKRIELSARQYCADDEEMKDGLCYKKCKPGFNAGVTICEFSKDVKSGTFKNAISNCK